MAFYPIRCLAKSCNRTARTGEGDIAEHGAKDDRVLSFAAQVTTAGRTAAVPIDEGGSLSGDDMLLQALLQGFALADRQANGFELVVALLEMQDLAVGDYGAIVADDPQLKVNVHGRRHAFRKLQGIQPPNYLPSPAQATNLPRFLLLSCRMAHSCNDLQSPYGSSADDVRVETSTCKKRCLRCRCSQYVYLDIICEVSEIEDMVAS